MKKDIQAGWTLTDPDNHQYGKKILDGHYRFKELDWYYFGMSNISDIEDVYLEDNWNNSDLWIEIDVVLSHYTDEEIRKVVSAYYGSLEELKEVYGESSEWIIAECIFEQETGNY